MAARRTLRMRTTGYPGSPGRVQQQGQPQRPLTDPKRIPAQGTPTRHTCAECFGPRSAYRRGWFCVKCELALFGDSRDGCGHFIRSERARHVQAQRKKVQEPESPM